MCLCVCLYKEIRGFGADYLLIDLYLVDPIVVVDVDF